MSKQTINLGTAPTGVGGDTPRSAFTKTQSNFDELYAALGASGSPLALPAALPIAQGGTGNATGTATKLAPAAIVGPVSQSGGVPTGAIIERGSNANGTYVKFADGSLEVTNTRTIFASIYNLAAAPIYRSDAFLGSDFAYPFIAQPTITVTVTSPTSQLAWLVSQGTDSLTKFPSVYLLSYYNPVNITWRINEVAKGRWF